VCRSGEWVLKRKALLLVAISLLLFFLFDGWSLRMTLKHIHYIHRSSRRNGLRSKSKLCWSLYGLNQAPRISVGEDENIHDSSYS
jgi:hypothetical protein